MSGPIRKFSLPLAKCLWDQDQSVACENTHMTDVYSSAENTITLENYSSCFGGHLLSHFCE